MHCVVWSVFYCILSSAAVGQCIEFSQAVFGAARHIPSRELYTVKTVVGQLADCITHPQIASYPKRVLPSGSTRTSLSDTSSGSMSPVMHCAMTSLHYMQCNKFRQSVILSLGSRRTTLQVNSHCVTWHDGLKPGSSNNSNKLTNQMQQFYKFITWRFVSLNMFRAPPRPSSGAQQLQ